MGVVILMHTDAIITLGPAPRAREAFVAIARQILQKFDVSDLGVTRTEAHPKKLVGGRPAAQNWI
ncbi:MAG: hypothetical protein EDM03_08870 [Porphyrobacter sp. IPPAS B-1204]|nr:MAG: hypothetical protein EDM03_08870 [Porphyrobacter sp. IPPAS B-1204]